jgi:hypothetical protein
MVAAVRNDPARRLELAASFYDRRAGAASIRSYRRAELAFMRWQLRRGVLAGPDAERPGSPWSLHNILPSRYPLDGISMQEILAAENYLGRLIDYGMVLPRAHALYVHAASELDEPQLLEMLRDGWPVYSWPYQERDVWTTSKAPVAIGLLTRLTRLTTLTTGAATRP